MKHLKLLLLFLIIFVSCGRENSIEGEDYTLLDSEKERIEKIVIDDLTNYFRSETGRPPQIKIESSKLKKIDNLPYLISKHGEYITTSLLERNSETRHYVYAGISCTSKACSSDETGCVPKNNKACTDCAYGIGDCVKTTTLEPKKNTKEKDKTEKKED